MELFLYYLGIIFATMLVFFIGTIYGWALHQRMIARRIRNALSSLSEKLDGEVIQINIEKHDDMIYVYNKETKQFMAQGKTRSEVENALADKFPGKRFAAPESELESGFSE